MHDGRASTLEDAILDHAGEGAAASSAFSTLRDTNFDDADKLIEFLQTLGRDPAHTNV